MSAAPAHGGALPRRELPLQDSLSRGFHLGEWWVQPEDGKLTLGEESQRLSPLQMSLLVFLASRRGKVVPKEKLFEEVWRGAAVEDNALPRCISEIRKTLGDKVQQPAYIETIPRRGYRLLATVSITEESPMAGEPTREEPTFGRPAPGEPMPLVEELDPATGQAVSTRGMPVSVSTRSLNRGRAMTSLGLVVASVALYASLLAAGQCRSDPATPNPAIADLSASTFRPAGPTAQPEGASIAVLGFRNLSEKSEHAWLSTALSEMLASELALSPRLRSIPAQTVSWARHELSIGDEAPSAATLHRIQAVLGADRVVFGSYLAIDDGDNGGQLRIDLQVEDTRSGEIEATLVERGRRGELLELVSLLGMRLLEELEIADSSFGEAGVPRRSLPRRPPAVLIVREEQEVAAATRTVGHRWAVTCGVVPAGSGAGRTLNRLVDHGEGMAASADREPQLLLPLFDLDLETGELPEEAVLDPMPSHQ